MLTGVFPALITPMHHGLLDEAALRRHIEWVIASGVHGIVPCGTTGEAGALTPDEYRRVVTLAVETARGRVPVVAGAGANITAKAIEWSKLCADCGADGLLHVTPYYNKPTQRGLRLHFEAVARATPLPIILYNVPGRTGVNMLPETVTHLATVENIVGLKDAAGNMDQSRAHMQSVPAGFTLFSGNDDFNLPLYQLGYRGAISVTANVMPKEVADCWEAWHAGKAAAAKQWQETLLPIDAAMFYEPNPIPVKTALAMMGRCAEEWRLPLCAMEPGTRERLAQVLRAAGVLTPSARECA
ncbi:MAG: 4-hydroxy-tetrahydrodipicolinate synthase [Deltaproteobacteria bacterium]|nr:4-hydroxy-tetrahydrodipicolinate synthase [Deltaproteobacteria bacterium]